MLILVHSQSYYNIWCTVVTFGRSIRAKTTRVDVILNNSQIYD